MDYILTNKKIKERKTMYLPKFHAVIDVSRDWTVDGEEDALAPMNKPLYDLIEKRRESPLLICF